MVILYITKSCVYLHLYIAYTNNDIDVERVDSINDIDVILDRKMSLMSTHRILNKSMEILGLIKKQTRK